MYEKIKNPDTGLYVNINSSTGKMVLNRYIKMIGGQSQNGLRQRPPTQKSIQECENIKIQSDCESPCVWSNSGSLRGFCYHEKSSKFRITDTTKIAETLVNYEANVYTAFILSTGLVGEDESFIELMYSLGEFYLSVAKCTATRLMVGSLPGEFIYNLSNTIFSLLLEPAYAMGIPIHFIELVIIGPITEELQYSSINHMAFDIIVIRLLDKMIPRRWDVDFKTDGSKAREIAFVIFSIFINAPLFAMGHVGREDDYTLYWGRIIIDQVYRRYGISGSIIYHALWNLMVPILPGGVTACSLCMYVISKLDIVKTLADKFIKSVNRAEAPHEHQEGGNVGDRLDISLYKTFGKKTRYL